jgi:thiol-disulfide isomerase/thioredoxin
MPVERALLALLIIILGLTAYRLGTGAVLRRRAQRGLQLEAYQRGRPAILYFTMPFCMPCETVQAPALRELQARFGQRLQVIEIDAAQSPEQADRWGVLSVPTTFIIDAQGQPRGVNHGVARVDKLERQLLAIGEHRPQLQPSARPSAQLTTEPPEMKKVD